MSARDPGFDSYVMKISAVLDRLDYYRLLGLGESAKLADVKKAFYSIAEKFHPDRNRDASKEVQAAVYAIFKRINEAYRVLCDPQRRAAYDASLKQGNMRLDQEARKTAIPKTPEDTISSREARQFYRQAAEALQKGNLMQAELHIKVAASREPGSAAIKQLEARIRAEKASKKKA
ncbi:MAG: DnaJ domain-containing protein [Deltaproteobacteria bacterium]|nr:DnaJ domain-containing protein [Deltaproteobacteria bacterium]